MEKSYKKLIVWQKGVDLVTEIYALTAKLPRSETYGLISQIQRSAVSIPSNITEGSRRRSKKDFQHFLSISFGSGSELETQIEILRRLPFGKNLKYEKIDSLLTEIMKMLNVMVYGSKIHSEPTNY
ncbi:MAG: four helix bundle protein [Candidatus Paceibacterota bacterium]